ncbi:ATP-binding cassette domain-containing protein [Geofilum rhodophaeum]|uniref:ATP-binding cassette domain-containing protein n=1 Tax=Geofilum rhodophaeum TaxID=1965019 RepID=UPI000B52237A|nr:ATP-binding cassette domain-containing protein [Geofilum rhodophaeum]
MNGFIYKHLFRPLAGRWLKGFVLLLFWTIAFIALPAISGWFIAMSSVVFLTANTTFSYLVPSAGIRLLTLLRTAMRYFERLENHKSTLDAQSRLQLKIFQSVARFPFFKKQVNNNAAILENSTHGIDLILNHILLWILPLAALLIALGLYFFFLQLFSLVVALEFLISSAVLLFLLPQYLLLKNRRLFARLKQLREEDNQLLIESFRGRIEISKYQLEEKAIEQQVQRLTKLEQLEGQLQSNSFSLQMLVGLGFGLLAVLMLWQAGSYDFTATMAIGVFFGIMAQAELSEMLFSGKSEKSSVYHQIKDLDAIIRAGDQPEERLVVGTPLEQVAWKQWRAQIPETRINTEPLSFSIKKGEWVALYGETGKGKTTLLNSLFYPEYRLSGTCSWNGEDLPRLPIPEAIYVSQKAYLLTGTLRENFEDFSDEDILSALKTVDLDSWYQALPKGLDSWLGENGETLSGGQRKKLLLAQALLKKPQLLVVDEPTAGISTDNALDIFRRLKQKNPDLSLLMATHQPAFEAEVNQVIRI